MGTIGADEIAAAWQRELPGVPTSSLGVITPLWRAAVWPSCAPTTGAAR